MSLRSVLLPWLSTEIWQHSLCLAFSSSSVTWQAVTHKSTYTQNSAISSIILNQATVCEAFFARGLGWGRKMTDITLLTIYPFPILDVSSPRLFLWAVAVFRLCTLYSKRHNQNSESNGGKGGSSGTIYKRKNRGLRITDIKNSFSSVTKISK